MYLLRFQFFPSYHIVHALNYSLRYLLIQKSRRRAKRVPVTDGPMIAYLNQVRKKKGSIDSLPFPKLSVLGADMEPIDNGDEVNQVSFPHNDIHFTG